MVQLHINIDCMADVCVLVVGDILIVIVSVLAAQEKKIKVTYFDLLVLFPFYLFAQLFFYVTFYSIVHFKCPNRKY